MKNLYIILIMFFSACDTDEKTDVADKGPLATPQFFFTKMTDLQVDVYAEPGAEPFSIESRRENLEGWNMVKQNLESLFERRQLTPTITVPESSTDFTPISSQNREGWDSNQIFEQPSSALGQGIRLQFFYELISNIFIL